MAKSKKQEVSDSSSSDSDSSSSDEETPKVVVKKVVKKVVPAKKEESSDSSDSDSSDSDSSDSEDEKPKAKAAPAVVKKVVKKVVPAKKEESSDSSDSDSSDSDSDSEDEKPTKAKAAPAVVKKVVAAKKEESDSSDSSDSDSSDSDSDDEKVEETKAEPVASKKRKMTEEVAEPVVTKKVAVENTEDAKIFIKGLPWKVEEYEITDFFKTAGKIASTEFVLQDDGRSSGTAYVVFEDVASVDKALALDGECIGGRWLKIMKANSPQARPRTTLPKDKPEGCTSIFMGNLSWEIDEETVRQTFADCGEIVHIRFATDRETGEFRGFGHVDFADGDAPDKAIALHGTRVAGREIRLDYAQPRAPREGGFGGRGGGRGRGGQDRGFGGRGGGRGRGGNDRGSFAPNKNKGSIGSFAGKKVSFGNDDDE